MHCMAIRQRRVPARRLRGLIPCGYCFEEWADCYDHIKPVAHGGTNRKENLYPACSRCNGLVAAKLFGSLEEKRLYVQSELRKRGEWHSAEEMRAMRGATKEEAPVAEILQPEVQMGILEDKQPKAKTCPKCGEPIVFPGKHKRRCEAKWKTGYRGKKWAVRP